MWEIDIGNQAVSFCLSMCMGSLFCAFYDIIRALRKICLNSFCAVFLTDILLWLFYAFATFVFLVSRTSGEIRGYVLFGELIGFLLFRITVSKFLFLLLRFVLINISTLNKKISKYINTIYIGFEHWILRILHFLVIKFKSIIKSVKKLLKKGRCLLYTNKNNANMENVLNETKT